MAAYQLPSYSVISPIVSIVYAPPPPPPPPPPPSFLNSPPPSQSDANSIPPPSSYPSPSLSPPVYTAPPQSLSSSSPPPSSVSPPPVISPPPLPSVDSPPLAYLSPQPPPLSPLPPPPLLTPALSPAPSSAVPPSVSPPPSSPLPAPPASPPTPIDFPPPILPPPPPFIYSSPPPPPLVTNPPTTSPSLPPSSANPPVNLSISPPPASPPLVEPLTGSFPPPPSAKPPSSSPPTPVSLSPSESQTPPSNPLMPPPVSSPPSPPTNSSGGHTHPTPAIPSPPSPSGPPFLPSLTSPSGSSATRSSDPNPNASTWTQSSNSTKNSGIMTGNVATIAVVTGFFMLTFVGAVVLFVRKRRNTVGPRQYAGGFVMPPGIGSSQMSESSYPRSQSVPPVRYSSGSHGFAYSPSEPGLGNTKLWFTYEELSVITSGFSMQNLLGEGGFGCVYKGCLQDGREVAVKQLKVGGAQGEREFKAEVEIISRVHHRHLVSLVGYCISEHHRLLVYDYVPNNTLYYHLHVKGRPALDWATRVKVAAGAARGIAYLHEDCHPRIMHRDIKSSNILLDNNFEAQVSDFGLARLARDACTHVSTRVMGTFGYMAPEYASSGKLTAKSDVYSFGVVLLELITGRTPVDASQPLGDESLVEWGRPLLSNALENREFGDLPDPRLENNYNESEMLQLIEAAAACVRHSAVMRPRMGQVVRALSSLGDLDLNNGVKPGQSELFVSEPQTEEIIRFQRMAFSSQDYSSDFSQTSWKRRRDL